MAREHPASGLLNAGRMMYVGRVPRDQPITPGRSTGELALAREDRSVTPPRRGDGGGHCFAAVADIRQGPDVALQTWDGGGTDSLGKWPSEGKSSLTRGDLARLGE